MNKSQSRIMHKITDWRVEDDLQHEENTVMLSVNLKDCRIDIAEEGLDETGRHVWIELEGDKIRLHVYMPGHDEPVNLDIEGSGITIDTHDFGSDNLRILTADR